tara:strand:+ start:31892 stop:35533 length:3642 start_codon:yes stop_codon:yes gene_type:complete
MQGTLSIYQGYLDGGNPVTESTPIIQERNLIVDGMKEHVVNMLTRIPAPSAIDADVSSSYNVSNFTVQGFTLSPNRSAFDRVHALGALSGYVATGALTSVYRNLDPSDGTVWAYNPDIPNHQFSAVNVSGGITPNTQLVNPDFSLLDPLLLNGNFRDYSLDRALSGVHMNEILSLYELNGWEVYSVLRYGITSSEFEDAIRFGSCSRYNLKDVSEVYGFLSGTTPSATYGEADDGILYIRSFQDAPQVADGSGLVKLKQHFAVRTPEILKESVVDGTDNVLAEITAQFSSLSGGANSEIHLNVRDRTNGEHYNFSATAGLSRNSWGGSGAPLVLNAAAGVSGTLSEFINIPSSKANHTFSVEFEFYCHDLADVLKCYFWNSNVNLLQGWRWGNIFSGQGMHRVWDNDYRNPALFINAEGSVGAAPTAVPLSSTTYLTQPFKMEPLKKYSIITAFSGTAAFTAGSDIINTAIVKRFTSDTSYATGYNYLSTSSSFPLRETRLPSNFAFSPEYPPTTPPNSVDLQSATVRPSDLCLEVSGGATVSGTFELPTNNPALLSGEVIRTFRTGVVATDHLKISLRTVGFDANGNQRWFNFKSGGWEVSSGSVSASIYLDSSSIYGSGFAAFNAPQIELNTLIGIVKPNDNNAYDLLLALENGGTNPAFVKNLRVNSYPKTLAQDTQEVFKFTSPVASECWQDIIYSGQNILSGLTTDTVLNSNTESDSNTLNLLGTYPIEAMYDSSGSCHAADSDYRLYLMQSAATTGSAGKAYKFNVINIVDDSLVVAMDTPDTDIITSESYVNTQRFDFVNQPYVEWADSFNVYPPSSVIHPGACLQSPASHALYGTLNQSNASLILASNNSQNRGDFPSCQLSYVENLDGIHLPTGATQRSFTFEYNQAANSVEPPMRWRACATTKDKAVVWWNASTSSWGEYVLSSIPNNDYPETLQRSGISNVKTATSTRYDITNERFDKTTKIKTSIFMYSWDAVDIITLLNWKFYTNGPYPEMDMPEFPAPNQTTVQTPVTPYAELGHYTNQIALSASLSAINLDRALGNINWAPSAGLSISGVEAKSALNTYDVINSDGYVLFGYEGPKDQGGFPYYVNGFNATSSTSSMTYTLDVSSGALDYFQMQGGVGAIGLHTFNVDETYRKLKTNGFNLSTIYDTSAATADSLYNLSDVTRNPVFRLVAKKVFRTPLSYTTGANKFIRLSWEIRFI